MIDVPILVCACGKRLKAPGAKPGRLGRCPACGGTMRVPEAEPTPVAVAEVPVEAPLAGKVERRGRKRNGNESAIWDGFIKPPAKLETTFQESLLYPFWGAQGVVLLVLFPPVLWLLSLVVIMLISTLIAGVARYPIGIILMLIPFGAPLAAVVGYTLLFFGRVLASSAVGEPRPPRWPDWDFSAVFFGAGRWCWAGLVGFGVGGVPAIAYWIYCGHIDPFDAMILTELLAAGSVYALMALLASILHEDLLAANPFTVVAAIRRVGWSYAPICLWTGGAAVVTVTLLGGAFEVSSPLGSAFLFWLFWVVGLYEAMVLLRVFGLFYHRHARTLGWFRGRTGWGV